MTEKTARRWIRAIVTVGIILLTGVGWFLWTQRIHPHPRPIFAQHLAPAPVASERPSTDSLEKEIKSFCGDCHAVPKADSFPRYAWHDEVRMGYSLYAKSGRTDLNPPAIADTVAYYRQRAPEQLTFPTPAEATTPLGCEFRADRIQLERNDEVRPAVAHLRWMQLGAKRSWQLVASDMRRGTLLATSVPPTKGVPPRLLATLEHPCHFEPCDLDGDGRQDLVVADLGSFPPGDQDRGRVVWLRMRDDGDEYEVHSLADGLGRVSDVRPMDVDRDGDEDLIVAVFGMDKTGKILLLRNDSGSSTRPTFTAEMIDPLPGGIHVPVCDLDGDGNMDFVALISQEYEQVSVFVNAFGSESTGASFLQQLIWRGPDLTFGSSGLELVDLDADDDLDILLTNGDAFDNGFVNASHGVQWLENQGGLKFSYHRLADLLGAYVAKAGDVDLDGDLDIVAAAWLPGEVEPKNAFDRPRASIICLEQTAPGAFARHTLEKDLPIHASLELADFDSDGDLDFAIGSHTLTRSTDLPHWIGLWWNQARSPMADGS